jgi:hypothetical protein
VAGDGLVDAGVAPPGQGPAAVSRRLASLPDGLAVERGDEPGRQRALDTTCDGRNWFGWPCDEELAKLGLAYLAAKNGDERKRRSTRSNCGSSNRRPYAYPGQYFPRSPTAKTG